MGWVARIFFSVVFVSFAPTACSGVSIPIKAESVAAQALEEV